MRKAIVGITCLLASAGIYASSAPGITLKLKTNVQVVSKIPLQAPNYDIVCKTNPELIPDQTYVIVTNAFSGRQLVLSDKQPQASIKDNMAIAGTHQGLIDAVWSSFTSSNNLPVQEVDVQCSAIPTKSK